MNSEAASLEASESTNRPQRDRPNASDWLWRPGYAKLWWAAIAVYWSGKLGSYWSSVLDDVYTTALAGYLNIVFYPFTALMVLGASFVHSWMEYRGLEWGAPSHDQLFPRRSVGGFRDPMADPLDPRSLQYWHGAHNRKP